MRHSNLRTLGVAIGAGLSVAACAGGPSGPIPTLPPTATGPLVSAQPLSSSALFSDQAARDDWWRLYDDPTLDSLVAQALVQNNQLEAADANLRAVRASLSQARAARLPTTNTSAAYSYSRGSAATSPVPVPGGGSLPETEVYDVGLDVSYELDLFGRVGAAIRAAQADAEVAEAAVLTARVSVAAETARAYADICSSNAQIAVAERTLALQSRTADLTQRLLQGGVGTGLDTARARSAVETTRATLPSLRTQRETAFFRLATLTGVAPAELEPSLRTCQSAPLLAQPVPIGGDGAALLARRPDVRQAERRLAAATARLGVATASLMPRVSLGGSVGATALSLGGLGDSEAFRFGLGPLISWSFPNVAVARAQIEQADALAQAALADFDQSVLVALQETETALTTYANELDRSAALAVARDEAARAATLSRQRFDAGADSFLTVLDAERTLAQSDAALAQSQALVTTYQVTLFKALAGGWQGD